LLLLSGAVLFVRTLQNLNAVDAGFRKDHVLLLSLNRGVSGRLAASAAAIRKELYARFSSLPGIQSVTLSMDTPLGGLSYGAGISVPGHIPENDEAQVHHNHVGPRFFETLVIPLLSVRD